MAKAYRINLVCPHMDHSQWVLIEDSSLSLIEILNTQFTFNCPVHGKQHEKPFQGEEKTDWPAEDNWCSIAKCAERPIETVNHRSFCRDHFMLVCQGQLDIYSQRLKEQNWRELSFELVEQFISDCMRGADRIENGDRRLEDFQRAQLLNIILSAAELGRHLRRSPRKALALPIRLISETPQKVWEEDTETIHVSQFGALVQSHRPVALNQQLRVQNDKGQHARARVAWCPSGRDTRPVVAIEFLDHDNFWGMAWTSKKD